MVKRLYVGNLPHSFTSSDLEGLFAAVGSVRSAEVIMDRTTGQSRGFGFVEMDTPDDTEKAIRELNGSSAGGRTIRVNEARERAGGAGGRPERTGFGRSGPRGGLYRRM